MSSEAMQVNEASPGYLAKAQAQDMPTGYKRTEAGVIPKDWDCDRLGAQCDQVTKGTTPTSLGKRFTTDGVRFLKAESISEDGRIIPEMVAFIDESTHVLLRRSQLAAGDVLISIAGVLGRVGRVEECDLPANLNQALAIVRLSKRSAVDRSFLFWCLRGGVVQKQIRDINVQAAQANISLKNVRDFQLALPPVTEQRVVAEALSDVDGLLAVLDKLIAKKRAIKQAAMQQLLIGKTRLSGFSGEWETKQLGDIGVFLKGSGVTRVNAQSGPLACVRYGEIYTIHNDYIRAFSSWISTEVAATATRLEKGDLLFAGSGETKEEIGKCVAFLHSIEAYAGGDIVILRPRGVDSLFLGYALNTAAVNRQKASRGQGDAVVHISANALAQVSLPMPQMEEQTAIATVLTDMDADIATLEARRDKTRALKQGMMQQLLTGRVRLVKPSKAEAAC